MKKLDIYGLMIGDIVLAQYVDEDENPTHTAPVRVRGIDEDGSLCGEDWHFSCEPLERKEWAEGIDDLYGIPLTEEILKANGFEERKVGICEVWEIKGNYWYFLRHYKNNMPSVTDGYGNTKTFCFVHELQHALRLVGLNEFADNFKIE